MGQLGVPFSQNSWKQWDCAQSYNRKKEKTMAIVDDNTTNDQSNTGARQDAYQSAAAQTQKQRY